MILTQPDTCSEVMQWGLTKTRTGPDHRTTINFCARSQKCACTLDCKDLGHSPGLWPKRYQGNTVTIQRNYQTCVLAASHAAYASLLPYVNEHIQGQEMTKEDIEKTLPGPCTYHCTVFHHTHLTGQFSHFYFTPTCLCSCGLFKLGIATGQVGLTKSQTMDH